MQNNDKTKPLNACLTYVNMHVRDYCQNNNPCTQKKARRILAEQYKEMQKNGNKLN